MSTPTIHTPEMGTLPRLRMLAAASRAATELNWQREAAEQAARERSAATTEATHSIKVRFPATIAALLADGSIAFVGYPALHGDEVDIPTTPCAVAYLGEGIWLHHTEARDSYSVVRGRPTLLIACVCGRYREALVDDEYALARELEHIDANRDICLGTCTSPVRINPDETEEEA